MDLSIFQYEFTILALIACAIAGAISGLAGVIVVLRGYSLVGDAAAHAALPGVCLAFLVTGTKSSPLLALGAALSAMFSTWAIAWTSSRPRSRPDSSVASTLSVMFGLGSVLLSYVQHAGNGSQAGLSAWLFGNAASVTRQDVALLAVIWFVASLALWIFWRPVILATFDESFANSTGMPTRAIRTTLLVALAVVVVICAKVLGVILAAAMLIIPASTALLFARGVGWAVGVSMLLGAASGVAGSIASLAVAGVPTGPAIVVVAGSLFGTALLVRQVAPRLVQGALL